MGKRTKWTDEATDLLKVEEGFALSAVDPGSTPGFPGDKTDGAKALAAGLADLGELQERLYAQGRSGTATDSVLLVLQGMDTAGKGGIIRHVVGGVDPQGVRIANFQKPTPEELQHDFLWRIEKQLPPHGFIGAFDRSHYEDVLIGKVRNLAPAAEIERRYRAINEFERRATDEGIRLVKVMLHISKEEQYARLAERLERPDKHWKYDPVDVDERMLWDDYQDAYQVMFERTSTDYAPWFVVPADAKWYARLASQELVLTAMEDIDPQWPAPTFDVQGEQRRLELS